MDNQTLTLILNNGTATYTFTGTDNLAQCATKLDSLRKGQVSIIQLTGYAYGAVDSHFLERHRQYLLGAVLDNLDITNVTSLKSMFTSCIMLSTVKMRFKNPTNLVNTSEMFNGCTRLKTIYCDLDLNKQGLTSTNMFTGCTALTGAISYDSNKTNATYANPKTGYFTLGLKPIGFNGKAVDAVMYNSNNTVNHLYLNGTQIF